MESKEDILSEILDDIDKWHTGMSIMQDRLDKLNLPQARIRLEDAKQSLVHAQDCIMVSRIDILQQKLTE